MPLLDSTARPDRAEAAEERVAELARLTSGSQITEASLRNAREMLERNADGA